MVAEFSGLPWAGPGDTPIGWATPEMVQRVKTLKKKSPFGQFPIIVTKDGQTIGQTAACANYIGKLAGPWYEGVGDEYSTSQMLLSQFEDMYLLLKKYSNTSFVKVGDNQPDEGAIIEDGSTKSTAGFDHFWSVTAPHHLGCLERMTRPGVENAIHAFTDSVRPGELMIWSMIHQYKMASATCLDPFPRLAAWYAAFLADPRTQKVLRQKTAYGCMSYIYFLPPAGLPIPTLDVGLPPIGI